MNTKILMIYLVLQVHQMTCNGEDIQITKLENLLLPIQLGNARLVYSKHTFLHYVDLSTLVKQIDSLVQHFRIVLGSITQVNVTNPVSYHGLSQSMLTRTEYLINIIQKKFNNLNPHIRNKRGLINGIGKLNKWLFGNLDSDDENKYNQAISLLQKNQKNLIDETNLQISLYKKLIDHYNKSITILSKNQEKFNNDLEKFSASVYNKIETLESYLSFQGVLSELNLDCQATITFIDNLENAIVFSKLNSLHSSIVSSSEIIDMINHLHGIYDENQIPKFKNILTYYQFLGTQVSISDSKLIFAVHIPIFKPETFEFYHLYPIIQNHKIYTPTFPYLAREQKETQFEKEECPALENCYYCQQNFIPRDNCTLNLLEGHIPQNCHILEVNVQEMIVQQVTTDEVLIIPAKAQQILSKCKSNRYLEVVNPILIKIPKTCEIWANEQKYINDIQLTQGKPFILPKFQTDHIHTSGHYQRSNITKIDFDSLYEINEISRKLKPIQESSNTQMDTPIFGTILGLLITGLIVVAILKFKNKIPKCRKKKIEKTEEIPMEAHSKSHSILFET